MHEKRKLPYNKPVMTTYGSVNDITGGSGLSGDDGMGSGSDGSV